MTRVVVLTFSGARRWKEGAHPHESSILMWAPMVVLAIGSVASGFLLSFGSSLVNWLQPVVNASNAAGGKELMNPWVVSLLALAVVVLGAGYAITKYRTVEAVAPDKVSIFTKAARKDLFQDDLNDALLVKPGKALTLGLVATDNYVIDGAVRLVGWVLAEISDVLRKIQNGYVRTYALIMLAGVFIGALIIWVVTV